MKPAINDVMLAISSSLAGSIIVKVTVTMALSLIGAWFARRSRAAIRHALLAAAFGVLFVLPIVSILAPPLRIAVPAAVRQEQTVSTVTWFTEPIPGGPTVTSLGITPVTSRWSGLSLSVLLTGFWIAGMTLFLLPVFIGLWQVRGLRRSGLPWRRGQSVAEMVAVELGIHRRVEVLLHEAVPGPMICGAAKPAIVLPRDAENWEGEDLNRAIVHELEHIRRGDWVTRCLARTACAVYWFHPLVWIAWRKLVLEAERSCDDAVLGHSEAIAYADQLVELAKQLSTVRKSPIMAMANRADLATRVSALLDSRQRRGRAGTLSLAAACAAALVLVLLMSPLLLVAAPLRDALAQSTSTLRSDVGFSKPAAPGLPSKSQLDPSRVIAQGQTAQARPAQTSPAQAPQTPATATPSRLLTLLFDANSLDAQTLVRAREAAIKFVQTQAAPSDRIAVMMYTSKLNVLMDFTNNQDSILAALGMISTADAGNTGTNNPVAGTEFNIFTVDRQLAALKNAIRLLGALPDKKALIYIAKGIQGGSVDNQAQLIATVNAAVRANVSIWPVDVDARGLVIAPLR
jgi:beta-lactamase regulating signal transducer with metallopeptidase domain